jgi:hypothetical protein
LVASLFYLSKTKRASKKAPKRGFFCAIGDPAQYVNTLIDANFLLHDKTPLSLTKAIRAEPGVAGCHYSIGRSLK